MHMVATNSRRRIWENPFPMACSVNNGNWQSREKMVCPYQKRLQPWRSPAQKACETTLSENSETMWYRSTRQNLRKLQFFRTLQDGRKKTNQNNNNTFNQTKATTELKTWQETVYTGVSICTASSVQDICKLYRGDEVNIQNQRTKELYRSVTEYMILRVKHLPVLKNVVWSSS